MSRRSLSALALAVVAGVAAFCVPTMSGATFTSVSRNTVSTVTASSDWTPPTVAVRQPANAVSGSSVSVVADASDASGIATVVIQAMGNGTGIWNTLCTATTSPYTCTWNTTGYADGQASLRAIATDNAGYTTTSEIVTTNVANKLLLVLSDPGDAVKGNVGLTATLYNGLGVYNVSFQYAVAGSTTWKTIPGCTQLLTPYTCTWATTNTAFTQGESYDLRAVATGVGTATSASVTDVQVDNVAPTVTLTDPGTPLRGTVTLATTAADPDSGLASVVIDYQRSGTSTWTNACTLTVDPYSCRFDTTKLTDGTYAFRATATDNVGLTSTSTVTGRVVDNTVSAVSMEDPGSFLSGTTTLTASASSTAGITSVRIEKSPAGAGTWTTVCTDTTAPYSCSFDTTTVADGLYDFRAVLLDGANKTTTSAVVTNRRIDNSPLKAYDVQTANGTGTAGRLDAGDTIKLTYTQPINPASVFNGWTGTATAVTVRLRDGAQAGSVNTTDVLDILRNSTVLPLGSVNLKQNYIKNNKTTTYNATMVASTVTVNGVSATMLTITVGSADKVAGLRTVSAGATSMMVWTPSAAVTDLNGIPCSTAPASERGTADREF